jgi:tetratricopeptide (TPR) repeat protein
MITALVDYLAMFYQSGNLDQVEVIARSMLAAIPDDMVALQFLGLALHEKGRTDVAYRILKRVALRLDRQVGGTESNTYEPASVVSYREATRAHSGLADGWYRIAVLLARFGFHRSASQAFEAAAAARGPSHASAGEALSPQVGDRGSE